MNRLHKYFRDVVGFDLLFKDHYLNVMELPQLNKITFNTGIGLKAILDKKQILTVVLNMELITGQRPVITRAKKSIDKFKLREKMPVGCKVTLRKNNLYTFLDRFINIILPVMDNSNDIFNSYYYKQYILKQKEFSYYNQFLNPFVNLVNSKENSISEHFNILHNSEKSLINLEEEKHISLSHPAALILPYFKVKAQLDNATTFMKCAPSFRSKLWLDVALPNLEKGTGINTIFKTKLNFSKKKFIPKGINFLNQIELCNLNKTQQVFFYQHTFYISNISLIKNNTKSFSSPVSSYFKKKVLKTKETSLAQITNLEKIRETNSFLNYYTIAFGFKDFMSSTAFGTIFNSGQLDVSYGLDIVFVLSFLKKTEKNIIIPHYLFSSLQMPF